MFGIFFKHHPDLRRLLTDYGFAGNPLRRDFPLTGFLEVGYDEEEKRVMYLLASLSQAMRHFQNPPA